MCGFKMGNVFGLHKRYRLRASRNADSKLFTVLGKNVANPTAMLLSAAQMLDFIGLKSDAGRLRDAINKVLIEGKIKTRDLGGFATTNQFTTAVIRKL